jgi:hypothetical protein
MQTLLAKEKPQQRMNGQKVLLGFSCKVGCRAHIRFTELEENTALLLVDYYYPDHVNMAGIRVHADGVSQPPRSDCDFCNLW